MDKYQNPENKRKAINQMVGGIRERRAKAKAEAEARKKANDLDAKARVKKAQAEAKSWEDFEVSCIMGKPKSLLSIGEQAGQVLYKAVKVEPNLKDGQSSYTVEPPVESHISDQVTLNVDGLGVQSVIKSPANESHNLNLVARERLERQISDLIDKANQALKERTFLTRDALDILEMARNTAYTEPMGEVSVTIHEAARRLSELEPQFGRTANRLGNLAMEIRQSEQSREVSK